MATLVTQKSHHPFPVQDDVLLVTLAREIAMDIVSLEAILERYKITSNQWSKIQENPRFIELLKSAITEWHLGLPGAQAGEGAERFSVTINLGADAKLTFQKEIPAKVIDVTPTPQE
jgi:hypothetical protein